MKFHHDFHHQAYINNLNKAMAGKPEASLVSLMPGAKAAKLNNAGGGHYNHCLFWNIVGPKAGGEPTGALADKMKEAFGSFDDFKSQFSKGKGNKTYIVKPDNSCQGKGIFLTRSWENVDMSEVQVAQVSGLRRHRHAQIYTVSNSISLSVPSPRPTTRCMSVLLRPESLAPRSSRREGLMAQLHLLLSFMYPQRLAPT